jgi:uncharacterized protein (DUF362 family)
MTTVVLKETGKTLQKSFEKIFKHFNYIPQGKVFIKPNFSARPPIIEGESTSHIFLQELSDFLIKKGASEVIIGHGALLGTVDVKTSFEKMIKDGGFSFLNKIPKVRIIDLDKIPRKKITYKNVNFLIPKILDEVDLYINLAKLKTHMETIVSFSLKNQMGLVSMMDRVAMHQTELEKRIAFLGKLVKPSLNIIDGITAMEGDGPHHGKTRKLGLVIYGDDMVKVDSMASFIIGVDFKSVEQISIAEKIGVGKYPSKEELKMAEKYIVKDFKLAKKNKKFGKNIYVWPTFACSRCISILNEYGKIVKRHPLENLKFVKKALIGSKKINIVIGKANKLRLPKGEKVIAIGLCTKEFSEKCGINNLNRCPPSVKEVIDYIKKELNS